MEVEAEKETRQVAPPKLKSTLAGTSYWRPTHGLRPEFPRRHHRWRKAIGGLTALASIVAIPFIIDDPAKFGTLSLLGSVGIYLWATAKHSVPIPSPDDEALFGEQDERMEALVEVAIRQKGYLTGVDRGVAWIQDGALIFNGHSSSFVIGGEDLHAQQPPNHYREGYVPLRIRDKKRQRHIEVIVENVDRGFTDRPNLPIFFNDLNWFQYTKPHALRERFLPPLAMQPGRSLARSGSWLVRPMIVGIVGLTVLATSYLHIQPFALVLLVPLVGFGRGGQKGRDRLVKALKREEEPVGVNDPVGATQAGGSS